MAKSLGELRHRVVIETLALTTDGQGGSSEAWTTFATVWANIETRSRAENLFADKLRPTGTQVITIRWLDGVTPTMRVKYVNDYGTRYFQIKGVSREDERRFYLLLDVEENVGS